MSPSTFFRSLGSLGSVAWLVAAATISVYAEEPSETQEVEYRKPKTFLQLVSQSETLNLGADDGDTTESAGLGESEANGLQEFFKNPEETEFRLSDEEPEPISGSDSSAPDTLEETPDTDTDDSESKDQGTGVASLAKLPSIYSISLNKPVSPGILPRDYAAEAWSGNMEEYHSRGYRRQESYEALVSWEAPWVGYHPLYFEDIWLERHGVDFGCCQTLVSGAKFFGRLPLVPYMVGANPCRECVYSYGLGRPGDCTPHFFTLPKKSVRGALFQAASIGGLVWLTP